MHRNKIPQIVTLTQRNLISDVAGDNINKKPLLLQWFFRVGYTIELSNKFIVDFEKIIDFILVVLK